MEPVFELDPSNYFVNRTQQNLYDRNIKHKVLAKNCIWDLDSLSDFPCISLLLHSHLDTLFRLNEPIFPNLVKVFYTNMEYPTRVPGGFLTKVNGKTFPVTPDVINDLLQTSLPDSVYASSHKQFRNLEGLTERQVMEYVTTDSLVPQQFETMHVLKKADLSLNMQVFTELIQSILLPRKGHVDSVNFLDIWVMGALGLGIPLDLGFLITSYMHTACIHPQQSLPFSCLITLILYKYQVEIDPDEPSYPIPIRQHLSISAFRAKHWEKVDGEWRIKQKSQTDDASSSKRTRVDIPDDDTPAPASGSRSAAEEQHTLVMGRLDSLADSVQNVTTSLQHFQTYVQIRLDEQDQKLDTIQRSLNAYMGD